MVELQFPKIEFKFDKELVIEQKDVMGKYNLPEEVKFCKKCTLSNQRPRVRFDDEGVCSACRFNEKKDKAIDWGERDQQLKELCDRHRNKDGSWDVIVPCSGGKDSSMVAHRLKHEYDMHPLTVTWASHLDTDIGKQNLQNFIDSGFDNIFYRPDGVVYRRLSRLSFELLGDNFQPFIYGVKAFPLRIAAKFGIPLVMYGENGEVEYGGDTKNENSATHNVSHDMKKHYFSGVSVDDWKKYGFTDDELYCYKPPSIEEMNKIGLECHFFGYYHRWDPKFNVDYCIKNTGFCVSSERSEGTYTNFASLDDKTDGIHYYLAFIKFGIGRTTSDTAHEIREQRTARDEAIELVRKFDGEFPKKYFRDFLQYTGITEKRFWKVIDSWRSPHMWKKVDGHWNLRKAVYDEDGTSNEVPIYISSLP